jgi:hypothetical protein
MSVTCYVVSMQQMTETHSSSLSTVVVAAITLAAVKVRMLCATPCVLNTERVASQQYILEYACHSSTSMRAYTLNSTYFVNTASPCIIASSGMVGSIGHSLPKPTLSLSILPPLRNSLTGSATNAYCSPRSASGNRDGVLYIYIVC